MFSDHYAIKLEINNRTIYRKCPNIEKLNNMPLSNSLVKEESKKKLECILNGIKMKHNIKKNKV